MKLLSTAASLLFAFSTSALADHAVDNAREIARASYRAADAAEQLENEAYRDADFGRDPVFEDHRHDSLLRLAQDAQRLHISLSDLFRSARNAGGIREEEHATPEDHRGDDIRREFDRAQSDFYALQRTYYDLRPYSISNRIHLIYNSVERTFADLQWYVHGR